MKLRTLAAALFAAYALLAPASRAFAQGAAVADPPAAFHLPATDEGIPGVGALRREPWFIDLWKARRTAFADHAAQDHGAIVFYGDSITQGWNDDFYGGFDGAKCANRGISGDTSRGLIARLDDDVLALDPAAIVLLIGTNDLALGIAPQDIANNVGLLLEQIAAHDPKTPVILCEVMPSSESKQRPADKIRELNAALRKVAAGNNQVTVLDTYTLFANKQGDAKLEEFPDLLHPNEVGYAKWRAALIPLLATAGLVETEADDFTLEPGYTPLFNGRDLTGWGQRPTNDQDRADIANWSKNDPNMPPWPLIATPVDFDGAAASPDGRLAAINGRLLLTTPTEGRRIQHYFTTADFPHDFTLKLEFRATPNADSGVFLRGRQLQCRDYTLAGPYKNLKNYQPQQWNELVAEVKGRAARCTINGEEIEAAFELPATGPIGLEADRGQMEFRRIRVKREK